MIKSDNLLIRNSNSFMFVVINSIFWFVSTLLFSDSIWSDDYNCFKSNVLSTHLLCSNGTRLLTFKMWYIISSGGTARVSSIPLEEHLSSPSSSYSRHLENSLFTLFLPLGSRPLVPLPSWPCLTWVLGEIFPLGYTKPLQHTFLVQVWEPRDKIAG